MIRARSSKESTRRRLASAFGRLRRDTGGAAAVEFALISLPFLALCGGIVQIAFQIWAAQNFDRALQNGARSLFTGQFQQDNSGTTDKTMLLAALRANICGSANATIPNVFDCQNIKIDVTTSSTFGSASASTPVNSSTGTWTTNFGTNFTAPAPSTIFIATAAVPFPAIFNLLGLKMKRFTTGTESGSGLLISTAVFRTEPFPATTQTTNSQ